jgi:hypothetical protein
MTMLFDFHTLAVLTSIAATLLAIGWLFFGKAMLLRWGLEATTTDLMLGRRIGSLYAGLAWLMFAARNAPESELRTSVATAALLILILLGVAGTLAFLRRQAGPAILASVAVEIVLVVGYAGFLL